MRISTIAVCVLIAVVPGCRADEDATSSAEESAAGDVAGDAASGDMAPGDVASDDDVASETPPEIVTLDGAEQEARLAEVESALGRLPGLIASIRQDMRRHLNAAHVAAAQRNGVGPVRDAAHLTALMDAGRIVELQDSTPYWVVRELDRSRPYVTPGTGRALEEIGRRFQARLDERGLPPFRFEITSALRTGEQQAELRRRNRNASRTTSSHEFGTTFDVAYLGFAAPVTEPQLDSLAVEYAPHIEGELGAVLQAMQREGTLLTLRERSQPVFHITVGRDPSGR